MILDKNRQVKLERDPASGHRINGGVGIFWRKAQVPTVDLNGNWFASRQHVYVWIFGLRFDLSWETQLAPAQKPEGEQHGS